MTIPRGFNTGRHVGTGSRWHTSAHCEHTQPRPPHRPRPVLGRARLHRLPGLGAGPLHQRRDPRFRLPPTPPHRAGLPARGARADRRAVPGLGREARPGPPARPGPARLSSATPRSPASGPSSCRPTACPTPFVPGRNLLFLTLAATVAYRRGASVLVGGMCETDYSGYPDCRDNTLKAQQVALSLGLATPMTIETPLMFLTRPPPGDWRSNWAAPRWSNSPASTPTPATWASAARGTTGATAAATARRASCAPAATHSTWRSRAARAARADRRLGATTAVLVFSGAWALTTASCGCATASPWRNGSSWSPRCAS